MNRSLFPKFLLLVPIFTFALSSCGKSEETPEPPSGFFKEYGTGVANAGDYAKVSYVAKRKSNGDVIDRAGTDGIPPLAVRIGG